jgi:hypothetical protein
MAWAIGLGAPIVLLLCLGLPISVFVFMWFSRKQGRLNHTVFNTHYGFMYRLWRPEVCWWEAVVVVQTIGLVIVATFGFSMGPYFQVKEAIALLCFVAHLTCACSELGTTVLLRHGHCWISCHDCCGLLSCLLVLSVCTFIDACVYQLRRTACSGAASR